MFHISTWQRLTFCALLLTTATSCDDVLDQTPPAALTQEDAFANADRIQKTATGMYDQLQNAEFLGGRALIYSDIRSDDTNPTAFFGGIGTFTALANDGTATNAWTGGYRSLYGANFFIQEMAKNTGKVSATLEAQYVGEAKFIRALIYFHLVNLFAQPYNFTADASHPGVVLQLTAPDATSAFDPTQAKPRATVREVYTQIETDLNDAIAGLPETYSTAFDRTGRATKDAARSLLSRVYLYEGKYAEAATLAGAVITGGRRSLTASPAVPFTLATFQNAESIFSVAMNVSDNPNTNNALGQHYGRRADISVNPYALIPVSSFPADDRRRLLLLTPTAIPSSNSTPLVFTQKYKEASADYVPIVRYAETLLNRAEGLAQTATGVSAEAVTLLNQVRDRSKPAAAASYTVANFADKQALIEAILLERRLELAFEGHRYYDLMRYKRNSSRITYGAQRAVLPIPLVDIQQNPNLVQNPGY
ncbi:RagB/SusD family nutrient uptake outer membrane protein [Hymenobacter sp. BT186]|uniref:RagB/SusD family nutrient uptake outer membrane protein n=1 Tax=Hymenobacter telluris TaxID=2816474 RepID=A0A939JDU2_9BACT|nr:RagB/SusD family nutrient uptake outer membrane protein [Hymenobacter telluris]MBO0358707.1 RagB/SusD family nutrient uptake outer membrane protein [Hymenobacter telluris]MBW3374733.1 RagB/SusD family nutrient uptake outer membrane protein [Hymenobacter norwichensis]